MDERGNAKVYTLSPRMHFFLNSFLQQSLLEKRFIRTPGYQYWCRLVTVADTNNGWLSSHYQKSIIGIGCIKSADTNNRIDY
jgi:hypothetical protein